MILLRTHIRGTEPKAERGKEGLLVWIFFSLVKRGRQVAGYGETEREKRGSTT